MTDLEHKDDNGFIAVIGMAGRFPGAADLDAFWHNLTEGIDSISRGPSEKVPDPGGNASHTYVPARGRLDAAEWFDADHFGYSAKEAFLLDPQHRVFLECAVEALENAGQDPERFPGAIGVYGGCTETRYEQTLRAQRDRLPGVTAEDILLGTAPDFLTARTAQRLGLGGPAVTVQSACATALVALHTAGRGLLAGDCDLALAGGVAVHVPPKRIVWTGPDGTLSPDGVCRAFDARAAGTVASNGVGIVVLKRLSDALADGDHIRAVVRGSAVTNDGAHRIGFGAPSVQGQAAAVREAQLAAGTDARTITYVEAHGTATPLGDPIEITALTEAFRADTEDKGFCLVGSVKTNIGHADAAAGAAGLIKTVLALEHGTIPPSLHHTEPNPQIDFETSPFRVAARLQPWEPYGSVRRAGVSSFAVGGVNAHLVLEQAPPRPARDSARSAQLLVLSARTEPALRARIRQLTEHLERNPALPPADVAWTLQTGRREYEHRAFVVVGEDGTAGLARTDDGAVRVIRAVEPPRERPVALLFPGEVGPAETWRLHATEPAFREAFDACMDTVGPELAGRVRRVARGLTWADEPATRDVYVFALEYSLAALWQRWGVQPAVVHGTGVGSLVAATVAGALTLPDALALVVRRARDGADAPRPATVRAHPLRVPVILGDGRRHAAGAVIDADQWAAPGGDRMATDLALPTLLEDPDRILLQVGFGPALLSRAREHLTPAAAHRLVAAFPQRDSVGTDVLSALYTALGRLWLAGNAVSWPGVHDGERRFKVPLPGYPFQRLPYLLRHPDDEAAWGGGEGRAPQPTAPAQDHGPVPAAELAPSADGVGSRSGDGAADGTPLALVLRLFSEALGLEDIEPDESFFDLGGDSLIATKLLAEIRAVHPVEIKARALFATPTAAGLAELIERQLQGHDDAHGTQEESA
ncbi:MULTISPECIES: beta-ketoacyl synthase N-terminal-like domain-containing protein [unclassified Streptomyces]|uniref:type I polyketide synthase n=1 Tax=unclassified Streptomyces TaxID=2593676 RepID=UPI0036EA697D